nr:cytochrome P450 4V2-like [Aedes albopictus]
MAAVVLAFLLFTTFFSLLVLIRRYVIDNRYALKIPTVSPVHPLIGHCGLYMGKNTRQVFWLMAKCFRVVDRLSKLRFATIPVLLVNHPDLIQELMTRPELYDKPFFYEYMGLGKGLITEQRGQMWRRSRKLLNPTFSTRILNEFVPIMDARARKMIGSLAELADGKTEFDILPITAQCTLEMVFSTTMGCRMEERQGEREYVRCLEGLMTCIGERMLNIDRYLGPVYRFTKAYKVDKVCRDTCNGFTEKIIQERKHEMASNNNNIIDERLSSGEMDESRAKSLNFLDQILTIRRPDGTNFPDDEVSDHLYSIVGAGSETSALTISYACLFLAMDHQIQTKVSTEIKQVFPSRNTEVTPETLKQLAYMEMVLKETLRLCPAVPFAARSNETPIKRKDLWGDDPERFDPERFSTEASQNRHPYAYLPFSGGFRNCIGGRYALNSLKIMLLRILQNFHIDTSQKRENMRFRWAITMKLVGPHAVLLTRRDLYQQNPPSSQPQQ